MLMSRQFKFWNKKIEKVIFDLELDGIKYKDLELFEDDNEITRSYLHDEDGPWYSIDLPNGEAWDFQVYGDVSDEELDYETDYTQSDGYTTTIYENFFRNRKLMMQGWGMEETEKGSGEYTHNDLEIPNECFSNIRVIFSTEDLIETPSSVERPPVDESELYCDTIVDYARLYDLPKPELTKDALYKLAKDVYMQALSDIEDERFGAGYNDKGDNYLNPDDNESDYIIAIIQDLFLVDDDTFGKLPLE